MEKYCIGWPCGILLWAAVIWFFYCLKTGNWPRILGEDCPAPKTIYTHDSAKAAAIMNQRGPGGCGRNRGGDVQLLWDDSEPHHHDEVAWKNEIDKQTRRGHNYGVTVTKIIR